MTNENQFEDQVEEETPVREFQLEGSALYLVLGVLAVALAAAFFLGRWYERSQSPGGHSGQTAAAGETLFSDGVNSTEPPVEEAIEASTDFFDTIPGGGNNAEPEREARQEESTAVSEPAPAPDSKPVMESTPEPAGGPFYVQVSASGDRKAAEGMKKALDQLGYRSRIQTISNGSGNLYKVQVGGFPDKLTAAATVAKLEMAGFKGVWTTRVD